MIHAYPDFILDGTRRELGAMLDYAVNACGETLGEFYARFLSSGLAGPISEASPKYIGLSGVELAMLVAERTGSPLPQKEPFVFPGSPQYWTGWVLAYVSWYLNIDLVSLQRRGVTVDRIFSAFHPYHEADISKMTDLVLGWLAPGMENDNPLKRQRKIAGLTQRELARLSGHSLRAIRAWEQGQRSLGSASADGVRRLRQVLGCRMEDLL